MRICASCGTENPDAARFCLACGTPFADTGPAREVRKTVTVLFADIVGSTALGERTDPEALRQTMSRWFDEARTVLERHGGTVEKFIGDAVMAVFGVPRAHEDDALRAVRAAAELRSTLEGAAVDARIGVNTGEVVAGSGGQTLVTGDAVNVAARLEQAAAPNEILIGEATERLVRDAVSAEPVEALSLKGKSEPVRAFRLLEVHAGAEGRARRLDAPLIGRRRELDRLQSAFDDAVRANACQLFTLLGPAGVGKSRLVEELAGATRGRATLLRGRCLSYGEGITFWPVAEAIPGAAEVVAEGRPAVETFAAVRKLVEALAREQPVVLVFDDIHWGEPTFLDLVEHIADWSRDAPILLVCLARSELLDLRPGWGGGKLNATTALLEPLDDEHALQLVASLTELDEEAARRIVAAAEGNPLFVEEMAALARDGGDLATPPTIQALLQARLDRLAAEERTVLEAASIEGKQFHVSAVAELVGHMSGADPTAQLFSLVRKDLIRPDQASIPDEEAFRFRHQLICDAAYASLAKEGRAELHERFASWLERRANGAGEFDEILGHHLEQAYRYRSELGHEDEGARRLAQRAGGLLSAAGRRAFMRGDAPAAAALLGRAAELLPQDSDERLELLPSLSSALMQSGAEFAAVDAVIEDAVTHARARGNRAVEARAIVERLWIEENSRPGLRDDENEAIRAEAERVLAVLQEAGDHHGAALAWRMIADYHNSRGEGEAWTNAAEQALREARLSDDRATLGSFVWFLCGSMFFGATPASAGAARAEELLHELRGDRLAEAAAMRGLAGFRALQGRFHEARSLLAEVRAVIEDLGLRSLLPGISFFSGPLEMLAGDYEAAERALQPGIEILEAAGETGRLSSLVGLLAEVLALQGRFEEALAASDRTKALSAEIDAASQILWRIARAHALLGLGRAAEAERPAREAVKIGAASTFFSQHADAAVCLGEVLRALGKPAEAVEALAEAVRLYEQKGIIPGAARARALLAELSTT
jgi:class 3 adenylate cyclase/tetratricopeptide (TPR) repeat protein